MLTERIDTPFEIVSLKDPSLLELPDELIKRYADTRDIKDLKLDDHPTCKPSIFRVKPLEQKYDHLLQLGLDSIVASAREIVKHHLISARNYNDKNGLPLVTLENGELSKVSLEKMRADICQELATVIIQASQKDASDPFSPPRTWRQDWVRMKLFRSATAATAANASNPDTSTEQDQSHRRDSSAS